MSETTACIIYAAKSTKDRHLSIPEQLDDCREMAKENGWEIVGEFKDEGFTAFTGNRGPGLASAIDLAKRTAAERGRAFILAQHTSRFARGDGAAPNAPRALVELWHEWARANVRGRTVENDYALQTSVAAATQGEADHAESKRKSKSVRKGLRRRARDRGKLAGGPPPYGYRWVDSELVPVSGEVEIVRRIFAESIAGRSQVAIARALNRDGIPAQQVAKWMQPSVRRVLTNPIYVGAVRHDGEIYEGTHAAILDAETFEAAQRIREAAADVRRSTKNAKGNLRGSAPGSNNGGGRYPTGAHLFVKGLLRCRCGAAMIPRTDRRRNGETAETYRCLARHHDLDACDQMPVRREEIDAAMIDELDRRYLDLAATRERYAARKAADAAAAAGVLATAERELAQADDALARIRRDYRDGKISAADWSEFREELEAERSAAEAAAERARKRAAAVSDEDVSDEVLDRLRELRATVLGGLDRAPDLDALRKLLRQMFESVTYLPGPNGASLVFGLKWDVIDVDALRAGRGLSDVIVRQPIDLDARTSEREAFST